MHTNLLYLPESKHMTTKEMIIQLLIQERSGLSNKAIHTRLHSRFLKDISYQAARRALVELLDDGVLKKEKSSYQINVQWVKRLKEFSGELYKKFVQELDIQTIDKQTQKITIQTVREYGYFLVDFLGQLHYNETTALLMRCRHLPFPFGNSEFRGRLKKILVEHKARIIVTQNTFIDTFLTQWYKQASVIKKLKKETDFDTIIIGDMVIQIYFPDTAVKEMDLLYRARAMFNIKIIEQFVDFFYRRYKIEITISKNQVLAERIKTEGF